MLTMIPIFPLSGKAKIDVVALNQQLDLSRVFMLYFEINRLVLMVCTRSYIIIQKSIKYAELCILFDDRYFRRNVNRGFYVRTF